MIYQETIVGCTAPAYLVGMLIQQESTVEPILLGDKNPSKPPKKKQKRKKKAVEEPPVKRKRKKRKEKAA